MTSRRKRDDRGATIVEFALVFPIVLVAVFGIVQYGYQYWSLSTASATAREAARRLIVGTDPVCTIEDAKRQAAIPAVSSAPQVDVTYSDGVARRGALVSVRVQFQSLDIGLLPLPNDGWVDQTATSRVENIPIDPLFCDGP